MPLSERQFSYLKEMNIALWQPKPLAQQASDPKLSNVSDNVNENSAQQVKDVTATTTTALANKIPDNTPANTQQSAANEDFIAIDKQSLIKQTLFSDIAIALNVSLDDITFEQFDIKMANVQWFFSSDTTQAITIKQTDKQAQLITPNLAVIAASSSLKKALWQVLQA